MFSSNDYSNGVYPLALYLSSLSSYEHNIPSASYSHHQHQNQQNLHPNNPLLAAPCDHQFSSPSMPESLIDYMSFSSNNVMMEQNLVNGGCSNQVEALMRVKKPVKKDRHSKIQTAQGLRDRRVRLSIGIARQFFDLQDMLGFDKASKTLEWLLKKSRKAISEIVHTKKLNGSNFSDANIEDEFFVNNIVDEAEGKEEEEEEDEYRSFLSGSSSEYCEDAVFETKKQECGGPVHKDKRKKNESDNILSKGLRAKARERAKERARDKIGSRNTEHTKTVFEITQSQILDSLRSTNGDEGEVNMAHSLYEKPIKELNRFSGYLANQESNFIRRTIKPLALSATEQQNGGLMLKDQICSSNNINILPQQWDIYDPNPFVDPPFGALSNMNGSTRLQ